MGLIDTVSASTNPDVPDDELKAHLRRQAQKQRADVATRDRKLAGAAASQHFREQVTIDKSMMIGAYWPIRDEIDCKPLLVSLIDDGYQVCLPFVMGDDEPLVFRHWADGAPLYPAGFGTLAPAETAPIVSPDMMIIPLLGFDKTGTRLGYGKGHYDRTIAAMDKSPTLVGYAFSAQELDEIPRESHDVPMDYLITETQMWRFDS